MRQTAGFHFSLLHADGVSLHSASQMQRIRIRSNEKIRITIPHVAVVHTKCHFVPHSYQNATGRASIVGTCQQVEENLALDQW